MVLDDNKTTTTQNQNNQDDVKPVEVDIFAVTADAQQTYDESANAFERLATIKPGVYGVKLFAAEKGWKQWEKNGNLSYICDVVAKIVDTTLAPTGADLFQDFTLDWMVSTMVPKGRKTSTMATILAKMGFSLKVITGHKQLAQGFGKWLKTEPVVYVEVDWKCRVKKSDDPNLKDWVNLYYTAAQFPKGENGEPLERFEYTIGGITRMVAAKAEIVDVFGKINNVPNEKKHRSGAGAVTPTTVAKPAQVAQSQPIAVQQPQPAGGNGSVTDDLFSKL